MTNEDFGTTPKSGDLRDGSAARTFKDATSDVLSKASDVALQAGSKAKQTASETASSVNEQVREMLDRQIGSSWDFAAKVASSFQIAADDLEDKAPFAGGLVRNVADKVESYAEEFHDQTVEQVMRSASDFTRRQPALVFGLAALAGFLVFRTMKTVQGPSASPSIAPDGDEEAGRYGG